MAAANSVRARALNALGLTIIGLSVAALYIVALLGGVSPLAAYLHGQPMGLETRLSNDELDNAVKLDAAFARMGYRLDGVAGGREVPPVFLTSVPGDLAQVKQVETKKRVFLRVMLPLILVVNEEVAADRRRLAEIAQRRAKAQYVSRTDEEWLAETAQRYGMPGASPAALLVRVDTVPPSLALAQAAEESGWGTSRFTLEANNLYGHITTSGDGIVPEGDSGRRLAQFSSLHEAVRAYVHNLNTHRAYEALRRARAAIRARGHHPDGHGLAGALTAYSERGQAYVDTIRALIRKNGLFRFDRARLGNGRGRLVRLREEVIAWAE